MNNVRIIELNIKRVVECNKIIINGEIFANIRRIALLLYGISVKIIFLNDRNGTREVLTKCCYFSRRIEIKMAAL